jgi:O-antigen/teichoic acid export membrane protein
MRANILWALVSNLVGGAGGWATVVILTKAASPDTVGQYALGTAVATPLVLLGDLHLRATLGTDVRGRFPFCDYFGLRLAAGALVLGALPVVTYFVADSPQTWAAVILVGLLRLFDSVSDVFYGLYQQRERMLYVAQSVCLRWPLSLLVFAVALSYVNSLAWSLSAVIGVRILVAVAYDLPRSQSLLRTPLRLAEKTRTPDDREGTRIAPRLRVTALTALAGMTLPLGLVMMLYSLNSNIPVLVLERSHGKHAVGLYGPLLTLTSAGLLVTGSLGQATGPKLAVWYAEQNIPAFRSSLLRTVAVAAVLGGAGIAFAWLFGRPVLQWLYAPEYAEQSPVLVWLAAALLFDFIGSILGWGILATRKLRLYPVPYVVSTATGLLVALLLIPRHGLLGAAWSACVTSAGGALVQLLILPLAMASTVSKKGLSP